MARSLQIGIRGHCDRLDRQPRVVSARREENEVVFSFLTFGPFCRVRSSCWSECRSVVGALGALAGGEGLRYRINIEAMSALVAFNSRLEA